ncbi:MAG: hypothetical protein COS34_05945 [Lysobacterales bacterium CG02_land_8_20_14_3_00_62_12]|nr:MAG: hypothetical protein COS34_05945 [Xanthomonadales bacterium CG02_land_8_20_14_3_00_62_12]
MNRNRSATPRTPLASSTLDVSITDLIAEYVLRHRFENDGSTPIEAVFTFPVPLDAAFVGMCATIAGETVRAQIQPRRQASTTYDDAIAQGHSAVLLSAPEPGVLCSSLGNLKPGESGEIELRFVTELRVADRKARFSLPLLHRPRYGVWSLEYLDQPSHDFALSHPLSATIRVRGLLATAPVSCVTHAARFAQQGDALELSIAGAMLDRDLVLSFELLQELPACVHLIEDGDAALGLISCVLPPTPRPAIPLDLCLLLDCSGSMNGAAITQSRQALLSVTDALGPDDGIQVVRFGSTLAPLFRRPLRATAQVREALRELAPRINADLGGTEMGGALQHALKSFGPADAERSRAIILVTDGAVQASQLVTARTSAQALGVRIFVVAVGGCAATEVLGPLAESTGAVLERAVPAEPIDALVLCQFRRARCDGPVQVEAQWANTQADPIAIGIAYPGDALALAACVPGAITGDVYIRAPALDFALTLPIPAPSPAPALRALLGQQRYWLSDAGSRAKIALRYGLLSAETSAVLVKQRADGEQIEVMPTTVVVPQMVPEDMDTCEAMDSCEAMDACKDMDACLMPRFLRRDRNHTPDAALAGLASSPDAPATTISAASAHLIFSELYRTLRAHLLKPVAVAVTLTSVLEQLPADLRPAARDLLLASGLALDDPRAAVATLRALNALLNDSAFSDDEEARLTIASHVGRSTWAVLDDHEARLQERLKALMKKGSAGSAVAVAQAS